MEKYPTQRYSPQLEHLFQQGVYCGKKQKFQEAQAYFDKALSINPKYTDCWYNKGVMFLQEENYTEALQNFNRAISIDKTYIEAWVNKAICLEKKGDLAESESIRSYKYKDAMKVLDSALEIYILVPYTDIHQSVSNLEIASMIWCHKGLIYHKLGDNDLSLSSFNKGLEMNPEDSNLWYNKGVIYLKLDDYEQASLCFDKTIAIHPSHPSARFKRMLCHKKSGQIDESYLIGFFIQLLARDSNEAAQGLKETLASQNPVLQANEKTAIYNTIQHLGKLVPLHSENKEFMHKLLSWIHKIPVKD